MSGHMTMRRLRNVKLTAEEVGDDDELVAERAKQWEWWDQHLGEFD